EEIHAPNLLERSCRVPEDLSCFPGHFPELPVVPAVLQLDWAMDLVADLLDGPPCVEEIDPLKFAAFLRPGDRFQIRARVVSSDRVEFRVWGGETEYAQGRLRLAQKRRAP